LYVAFYQVGMIMLTKLNGTRLKYYTTHLPGKTKRS